MTETNTNFKERLKATQSRLLDIVDDIVESMAARRAEARATPPVVARRQFANVTRLWMFCNRSACRRSRCCRGEPRDCLTMAATLLPPEAFDHLLARNKGRAKRARRPRLNAAPSTGSPPWPRRTDRPPE